MFNLPIEKSYIMIQHWWTMELAKKASANIAKVSTGAALAFKELLDPKAVKLRFYDLIGNWN